MDWKNTTLCRDTVGVEGWVACRVVRAWVGGG